MMTQQATPHTALKFTEEEKRLIHERWVEAKASQFREIREQYEALEVQIQRIARHLNLTLPDA